MYKNSFRTTFADILKNWFYDWIGDELNRCLCGGHIEVYYYRIGVDDVCWERKCMYCNHVYEEN
jgi:hypothetical protein